MNKNNSKNENDCSREQKPIFNGYPYLMIGIKTWFFHINLLSKQNRQEHLFQIAKAQAEANKLRVFLVINENNCVYFSSGEETQILDQIPKGSTFVTGKLKLSVEQTVDEEFLLRREDFNTFFERNNKAGYFVGDLSKGGRKPTPEELAQLQGFQKNGLPKGLEICFVCDSYKGQCIDSGDYTQGLLVRVSCLCENNNLCARCGGTIYNRKINANYYNPEDRKMWHVPSFAVLFDHQCLEASIKKIKR